MSVMGNAGGATVAVHMYHLFSERKLSRKTGHVEQTPTVLELCCARGWPRAGGRQGLVILKVGVGRAEGRLSGVSRPESESHLVTSDEHL